MSDWEVVIDIVGEMHLRTASKLFSPAPVAYGLPPNHAVSPICLALPGVLPVLNRGAVELAIRAGLAVHGEIRRHSVFARKNYFYPDLPKGYQISQYEEPIIAGGWLDVALDETPPRIQRVRLVRIHLEEDAGKSIHDPAIAGDATLVDLNRAGVPLLEIVSEPDLRSAAEAVAYLRALRQLLRDMEISDADMERGHFRCDVNVSLRARGSDVLGTRTEIKNLNSFRSVEAALEAEIRRQSRLLESGERVEQATMAFDPESGRTRVLRRKENADDYRYFPDPDLVPLVLSEAEIDAVRKRLPEHAEARRARYQRDWSLTEEEAQGVFGVSARFFEQSVAESGAQLAKPLANWTRRDLKRLLNARGVEVESTALTPRAFATLVGQVEAGRITTASGQQLLPELLDTGADPAELIRERGLEAVSGGDVLARAIDEVIAEHAADVARVRAGEEKVLHFLIGQVMKRTRGKANPQAVRELLAARIASP